MYKENSRVYMCGRECTIYLIQESILIYSLMKYWVVSLITFFIINRKLVHILQSKVICNDYKVLTCRDS